MVLKEKPSGTPLIVFSDDWGKHPSSSQHIVRRLAQSHPVIWVNTVGMRRPNFNLVDIRKAITKLARMFGKKPADDDAVSENLFVVVQPLMLPFNTNRLVRRFNAWSARRTLRKISRLLNGLKPAVITTVPNSCDYVDAVESDNIIYYCVDDFSEWPGLDSKLVQEMEESLIAKADQFAATSTALFDRLSAYGKPVCMLTHGVDVEMFSQSSDDELPVLDSIPAPRIGYFGLFDERSDQSLLISLSKMVPDISIVIAGRVEADVHALQELSNVHFVGVIPYSSLPSLISGLDALFIPYCVDELSRYLSPLKLKEYLATGLPVLSTPIAAAVEMKEFMFLGDNAESWCQELQRILAGRAENRRLKVVESLAGESWEQKALEMEQLILSKMSRGTGSNHGY